MNQRKKGVILSYILVIISTIINLMYVPVLIFYMGQNEYGLYRLMGSIVAYFTIMDFGLSATIIRFYVKYKTLHEEQNMENLLAFSAFLYCGIAILITLIGGIFYFFIDDVFKNSLSVFEIISAKKIYILLLLNIFFAFSGNLFTAIIMAHERFVFLKGLTLLQVICQPVAVIAIMTVSPDAFSLVIVQSAFNFLMIIVKLVYSFQKLHVVIRYHFFDRKMFKSMSLFAGSIFTVAVVDQIYWQTNQIILGAVAGTAVVAIYAVAAQLYLNYMYLSKVISDVFLPRVTEMVENGEPIKKFSDLFIKIGRVQFLLLAMILSGFILYGQDFIKLWAGKNFIEAYYITLLIIVPFTIDLTQTIGLTIMQAYNQYGFRARVHLCMGVLNIIMAIPLAISYGGIGCAFVTGLMMFIGDGIIMNWYYAKTVQLDIRNFWKQILKILVVVLVCTLVGLLLKNIDIFTPAVNFVLKLILYMGLYITLTWNFAMNSYEKSLLINIIEKLKSQFKLSTYQGR